MHSAARKFMTATVISAISACAAPTKISSNKAVDYTEEPRRMYALINLGNEFGSEFANAFQKGFAAIAKDCDVDVDSGIISALDLDQDAHTRKMNAFKPDAVVSIRPNGGTKEAYGGRLIHAIYDVRLIDFKTRKTVWRANVDFYRGALVIPINERGEALAVDVSNKLKEDHIFRGCEIKKSKGLVMQTK